MTRIFLTGGTGHVGNIISGLLGNQSDVIHISFRKNKKKTHHSLFNLDDLLINETNSLTSSFLEW